ncbi:MAG: FKBP-type peptidyl-prolyl cis-trans isomerase [Candidatus Thorarchaeota archaeon]
MTISENDWIKINYTGRLKEDSKVFDTTLEEVARAEGIFDDKRTYNPMICRAGDEKFLIPGLAKALVGLDLNSPQSIEVPMAEGYGERDTSKIEMVPTRRLRKANITPQVGRHVQLAGRSGTIIWVGGGRSRIDFNHPLAGKNLIFEVTVIEQLEDETAIQKEIIGRRLAGINIDDITIETAEDPRNITITLPSYVIFMEGLGIAKYSLATELRDYLDFKQVRFSELFDYQEKVESEETPETSESNEDIGGEATEELEES